MTSKPQLKLKVRPLTPELWPALEDLFGPLGACNGCWCMYWRIGAAYRKRARIQNKTDFHAVVKNGPPPGLLAFEEHSAVGWCQLTPRKGLPHLDHVWRLKPVDDAPVWCISCFYVRKGYRRRGVTSALIEAAARYAKRAGAPALEPIQSTGKCRRALPRRDLLPLSLKPDSKRLHDIRWSGQLCGFIFD